MYQLNSEPQSKKQYEFQGKVALVTGASSGIGAATAIAFAKEGAKVVMVGRNETKLKVVNEECLKKGSKPLVIIADVSKEADVKRIVTDTISQFGKIDVLVNNAGIAKHASILAPEAMEVYDSVMSTNLRAVVHLTHLAGPHLVASKGNIVNISSVAAKIIMTDQSSAYHCSKAGMDHFTRAVALELAAKGVRVNAVNPGPVKTDIIDNPNVTAEQRDAMFDAAAKLCPLGRYGEPEEIADVILFLASDKAKSITGSTYVSDNGALLSGLMRFGN